MLWLIGIDLLASHHEFGVTVSLLGVSNELYSFLPSRISPLPCDHFYGRSTRKELKSVKFHGNTNEINQSNAKTDAPKTVSYPR
ncbi:MAG: hypothetical protein DWI06_02175 [Planctomycetota bacterium]|nr:MAG: hypothetical protein DWI06_02175 [Planctomycetota bacterium]